MRIGHRFTKANQIVLPHIGGGKTAVATLNAYQQALLRTDAID